MERGASDELFGENHIEKFSQKVVGKSDNNWGIIDFLIVLLMQPQGAVSGEDLIFVSRDCPVTIVVLKNYVMRVCAARWPVCQSHS